MPQTSAGKVVLTPIPSKLRAPPFPKRQIGGGSRSSPSPKTLMRCENINEAFSNPWRCEAAPYVSLPIIHHEPVYNPPCYVDENMNHLTKSERVMRIMSYHRTLHAQLSNFARSQPQRAAVGDPLQTTTVFNSVFEKKKPVTQPGSVFLDQENTYISRSGRHVRRRQDPSAFQHSDDDDEDQQKSAKKAKMSEDYKMTPIIKRNSKKNTNEEIMARSLLFADSPVAKSPRAQAIFAKLEETEKSAKKAELQKKKFEKTMEQDEDDDFDMAVSSAIPSPDVVESIGDDDFLRRRIEPPIPKKRTIGTKIDSPSTSATKNTDDGEMKGNKASGSGPTSTTGAKRGSKKKLTDCPICGKCFSTKAIQEHASTCGLTNEVEIESSIPN